MLKLSIIIPVYNVENYLPKCLDSIIAQDCKDCEILLINDGSTDRSGAICDKYGEKYNNVLVFHKENGGLSDARNFGVEKAVGQYLMFVDSDDYLEPQSLNKIISKLDEFCPDLLTAKSFVVGEDGNARDEVKYQIHEKLYVRDEFLKVLKKNRKSIIFCAQYFVCKRELVIYNKLSFKKGIIHEDELWTPQLLLKANNIYYLDYYFYYHLMRENSIMHSDNDEKSGLSLINITNDLQQIYGKSKQFIYLKDRMASFYLQAYTKLGYVNIGLFDRKLPMNNAYYLNTKIKSIIFRFFPKLYLSLWKKKYKK